MWGAMSKYTEKLAEAYLIAKNQLEFEDRLKDTSLDLLSKIILEIAIERPIRFAEPKTLAEEVLRRYDLDGQ